MRLSVALVALVLLAGCSSVLAPDDEGSSVEGERGVVDGVAATDDLNVTTEDGLNESELDRVVARMMARIEVIRDLEFKRRVPVEVITRDQYRSRRGSGGGGEPDPVEEQLHEAAFLVGEDRTVGGARGEVFGQNVLGFYNGSHIVIVTDQQDGFRISRATLVHELQHALQAQHFSLGSRNPSHDGRLAARGIVEGDANYVEFEYESRCDSEWECIPPVESGGGGGDGPANVGVYLTVFTPYSEGPQLVQELRDRDGWSAVDDAFQSKPTSTEQVIHPTAYPDEQPVEVSIPDRSTDGWRRVDRERTGNTVGEATLYTGLWVNGAIPEENLRSGGTDRSPFSYDHPATAGWGGDRVVAYTNGSHAGYVFRTVWDSEEDAEQFHAAYVELLRNRGAREVDDGVYRVPDNSSFGDAFRVVRKGDAVVIVNAPTVADLDAVHDVDGETDTDESSEGAPIGQPGAGGLGALVALAVAVAALRRVGRSDAS